MSAASVVDTHDIGYCWSCTRESCPHPKRKERHPELGCDDWDNEPRKTPIEP
jgi:hypothetical protein